MARTSKLEQLSSAKNLLLAEGYEVLAPNTMKCTKCGKEKKQNKNKPDSSDSFYRTFSGIYKDAGILPICKTCIDQMYLDYCIQTKDNKKLAMYRLCQELNIYWSESHWDVSVESKSATNKVYIGKLNSLPQYNGLTMKDSDEYVGEIDEIVPIVEDKRMEKRKYNDEWMGTYSKSEIKYLDEYLDKLKSDFNIVTTNHIDYAKKIAKASLIMDKEYEKIINGEGSDSSYEKYKRIYDDLCKSAQFAESGRGKTAVGNGISEIVELVENKQWIFRRDDYEKDDIDLLLAQFSNINKSL